jgi:hypothetical protein
VKVEKKRKMPDDLESLTKCVNKMAEAIGQFIEHSRTKETAATSSIASISNFDVFNPDKESVGAYINRFQNYMSLLDVPPDTDTTHTQAKLLLSRLKSQQYEILAAEVSPADIKTKTYSEIVSLMEKKFTRKTMLLLERNKLLTRTQKSDESVQSFATELKKLAVGADFKCDHCKKVSDDAILTSKFVCGLRDTDIRTRLLEEEELKFEKAVQMAAAAESSKNSGQHAKDFESSSSNVVNKLDHTKRQPSRYRARSKYRNERRSGNRYNNYRSRSRSSINNRQYSDTRRRSNERIDFKALGVGNLCLRCGQENHFQYSCRIDCNTLNCAHCKKVGHVEKVCLNRLLKNKQQKVKNVELQYNDSDSSSGEEETYKLSSTAKKDDKHYETVTIDGKELRMQVDNGSRCSLISAQNFKKLKVLARIERTSKRFKPYLGNNCFDVLGKVRVNVLFRKRRECLKLYIVDDEKADTIMGREWMRALGLKIQYEVNYIENDSENNCTYEREIEEEFSDLFEKKIGKIPGIKLAYRVKDNPRPICCKSRPVPYSLRDRVDKELDYLEKEGVIERVDYSEWGSPVVPIEKTDGSLRLCIGYNVTINDHLEENRYPMKRMDELFNAVHGSRCFTKIDVRGAYSHVEVDDETAKLQTIVTHRGAYKYKRLAQGTKVAPGEFQRIMDQALAGLKNVIVYFDDIVVHGATVEECRDNVKACMEKLRSLNLHLKRKKCQFFKDEIEFLGHKITKEGLKKTDEKMTAVTDAPRPKNADEVRSFLGLVMYYAKFIENASALTAPLRELTKKDVRFVWTEREEQAFQAIKREICSPRVLTPFNPQHEIVLATDASPFGISGVLSHIINGEEKPVTFISRSLSASEQNYSQIDREALAIYWAIKKLHGYLYGYKFRLITDNKPLVAIFAPNKEIPIASAARLQRYAVFLKGYNYVVEHRSADAHQNADYFSRAPVKTIDKSKERTIDTVARIEINTINKIDIEFENIKEETEKCEEMKRLVKEMRDGTSRSTEFSLNEGVIFRGKRVYIPPTLREKLLAELHSTHTGVNKMKMLARRYIYWPNIDREIETLAKSCRRCNLIKAGPGKVPVHKWEKEEGPWIRLHMDYAGPKDGLWYFVVVDSFSSWPEVYKTKKPPNTQQTIEFLRSSFARFGIPLKLVSNNAS